jgi:hypothetical protein
MVFYEILGNQGAQFYDGEFSPYPMDLAAFVLDAKKPVGTSVKVVRGVRPGDMMFAAFNVVSDRLVDVLEAEAATGYRTHPIEVYNAKAGGASIPGYWLLCPTGRGGPMDPVAMQVVWQRPGGAISNYNGIYMDEDKWDGSDVFAIPGLGIGIYVVERLALAMRKAKLRNVRLTCNTDCRIY